MPQSMRRAASKPAESRSSRIDRPGCCNAAATCGSCCWVRRMREPSPIRGNEQGRDPLCHMARMGIFWATQLISAPMSRAAGCCDGARRAARSGSARRCWPRRRGAPPSVTAKPYKFGTVQPLTGVAASGGKTALVGVQMAVDQINKSGGIMGRPVELIVGDDQSKPDTGRRAVEKLVTEDNIDAHIGGFLSNICLACTPVWEENKIVNMIGVCLDTTLTTSKCSRYTFRSFDFAPAQAKAFTPYLVNKLGKRWYIALCRLRLGPVDPRRLCGRHQAEWRRGRRHARHTARHRRHDAVPVEDQRRFRRAVPYLLRPGCDQLCQPGL